MPEGPFQLAIPLWELVLRSVLIYLALLVGLRVFGKREVGQFTLFDLVMVLLVANAVQPAMTGPDSSLTGGIIIIVVLLGLNWSVGYLRLRSPLLRHALESHPTVIAQDGHWMPAALEHEGVEVEEAEAALREHGVETVADAKLVILEIDGSISVVPADSPTIRTRRRVRLMRKH
ncbi:MAG TPA: YetF domain-containing protein [Chloroflexota bacterium]